MIFALGVMLLYIMIDKKTTIKLANLIGIFDLERTTTNNITRQFLDNAQKMGEVIQNVPGIPRSFIVTEKSGKQTVQLCIPASMTIGDINNEFRKSILSVH